jgi:hypothetical protein
MFLHQNHGAEGGNGSIMVGMFVFVCLFLASVYLLFVVPERICETKLVLFVQLE